MGNHKNVIIFLILVYIDISVNISKTHTLRLGKPKSKDKRREIFNYNDSYMNVEDNYGKALPFLISHFQNNEFDSLSL
ncbi:MAG: hypothetical protein ACFFE5_13965 [Candidatus Thorarchaeota archaeon]